MNNNNLEERKKELQRQAKVNSIEAASLKLEKGEAISFKLMDLESYQRVRMRLSRVKKTTGLVYRTELDGNRLIVTRRK